MPHDASRDSFSPPLAPFEQDVSETVVLPDRLRASRDRAARGDVSGFGARAGDRLRLHRLAQVSGLTDSASGFRRPERQLIVMAFSLVLLVSFVSTTALPSSATTNRV